MIKTTLEVEDVLRKSCTYTKAPPMTQQELSVEVGQGTADLEDDG